MDRLTIDDRPSALSPQPSAVRRRAAILLVGALSALSACSRAAPRADLRAIPGQNVLLITIDTLRADALGAYGGPAEEGLEPPTRGL